MSGLKFDDKRHRYTLDDTPIPSVTTILGVLDKPGLPYWAAGLVARDAIENCAYWEQRIRSGEDPERIIRDLKRSPWKERDKAARRGTRIHQVLEAAAHGDPTDCPRDLLPMAQQAVDLLDREDVRTVETEARGYNRGLWYAGTIDLIATIRGEAWLLDWKSSRSVHETHVMQVAAYAHMDTILTIDGKEKPMPHIDRLGIIHISDESATLIDAGDPDGVAWDMFQGAHTIHARKQEITNMIKENQ
jgi:hypothetical protein